MTDIPALPHEDERSRSAAEALRLQECAAEPLRTIGRIQSHGTLFAVDEQTGVVVVASQDAEHWLGRRLDESGSETLTWAVSHAGAIDPVRVDFEGSAYDAIVHRGTDPLVVELEPAVVELDYVRTGVVSAIQRLATITDPDELRIQAAAEI